jgi:hypothetical protein
MTEQEKRAVTDALMRIVIGTATVADARLLAAAVNIDWEEISQ